MMLRRKRKIQLGIVAVLTCGLAAYSALRSVDTVDAPLAGATSAARHLLESEELANYPGDALSRDQRKNGGFILHLLGSMYMFVGLALVCDEFFVPSLEVITESLELEDDVAGATFLAAGGSAPELATSLLGTFVSKSDVGFGTIVGSAVFNILFVIGACAYFSTTVLELSWWPLARDSVYYCISLGVLAALFYDKNITWWEALIQFSLYFLYVFIMSKNKQLEACVRGMFLGQSRVDKVKDVEKDGAEGKKKGEVERTKTSYGVHRHFQASRGSRAQLDAMEMEKALEMVENEKKTSEKAALTSGSAKVSPTNESPKEFLGDDASEAKDSKEGAGDAKAESKNAAGAADSKEEGKDDGGDDDDSDDDDLPMDLRFPLSSDKRLIYILLAPITYSLYFTIPDVRRESCKKMYVLSFFASIAWIGIFSYFMVWWITVVGDSLGIPSEIMGLTILAIGTSVPDLLESVIVARQGKGDMAVSSSIGSNIFDITVGLPLPWLMYTIGYSSDIKVGTDGLFISVLLLFGMLVSCIISIAYLDWKMSKTLGIVFFILWLIFLAVSLMNEYVFT